MPHSHGYRARTRSMFARKFGEHGVNHLSTYMLNYKVRPVETLRVPLVMMMWCVWCVWLGLAVQRGRWRWGLVSVGARW